MEENKKMLEESLQKIKGLMGFQPGMTRTELKEQWQAVAGAVAGDAIAGKVLGGAVPAAVEKYAAGAIGNKISDALGGGNEEVDECDDVKEGDMKEEDEKEVEIDVEVKEEDEKEVEIDVEVKEDMFEKPEIKPGGYKMAHGFVNESVSNKEQKRINKEARLNKKLGIIEEQMSPAMAAGLTRGVATRQVRRSAKPRVAARQERRANRKSDRADRKADFRTAIGKEPKLADNVDQNTNGNVYTDFDSVWDYKLEDGMWYTHRKGQDKWISLANYPAAIKKLNAKYFPSANYSNPATQPTVEPTTADATPQPIRTPAPGKIDTSKIASPIIPIKPDKIGSLKT